MLFKIYSRYTLARCLNIEYKNKCLTNGVIKVLTLKLQARPGELEGQLYSIADLDKFLDMKDSAMKKEQVYKHFR